MIEAPARGAGNDGAFVIEYRPSRHIFKVRTRGIQQNGKVVIDYVRSVMVWKKAHAPHRDIFPEVKP